MKTPATRKTLGIIFLTLFIDLLGFSIIFPLFPAMLDYYLPGQGESAPGTALGSLYEWLTGLAGTTGAEGDARHLTAVFFGGILGSLYSLLQFLSAPFWGSLSDRLGRRPVLMLTIIGTAVSYLAWVFAANFWMLLFARAFGGLCAGNISVASACVADVTTREGRARGMAIIGVAFGTGFIFGPALGGLFASVNPLEWAPSLESYGINPFSMVALVALVLSLSNLVLVWRIFPETREQRATEAVERPEPRSPARLLLEMLRVRPAEVRRACGLFFLFMLSFTGLEFTFTFLARERFAYTPGQLALMFVYIGVILILTQGCFVRKYAHRLGERNLAIAGLVSGGVAFSILAFSHQVPLFYVGLTLFSFAIGALAPSTNALVSLYSAEDVQGRNLGIVRSAGALARAIGPILAAGLYFRYGPQTAYLLAAALMVPAVGIALSLPRPKRNPVD